MNIQIITSSYPAFEGDPGGTAGLFVQSFAQELAAQGHKVIVQPVGRKDSYQTTPGITVVPMPWKGGDQELASMNFFNPVNWFIFLKFFTEGKKCVLATHQKYQIDRTLCMWVIPCGIFGYWIKKKFRHDYDVWALGSDIWKIRKIPFIGKYLIRKVVRSARGVFADGYKLADDVKQIAQRNCTFLASSRRLPEPEKNLPALIPEDAHHLLFVGRYHTNKGPDLLMEAIAGIEKDLREKIQMHFFGAGPMEIQLKEMVERLGVGGSVTIGYPVNSKEFSNYLSRVSFLVIPSRVESIPVVFSDALQSGTPVISTPAGDLAYLIGKYKCGVLAEDISARALGRAIEDALKTRKEEYSEYIQNAYGEFEISQSVKRWVEGGGSS